MRFSPSILDLRTAMYTESKGSTQLLLISNSTLYGSGYLDHAESEIRDFLGATKRVLFVPYALYDRDAYAATARERFEQMGHELKSVHTTTSPPQAVAEADVVFIG